MCDIQECWAIVNIFIWALFLSIIACKIEKQRATFMRIQRHPVHHKVLLEVVAWHKPC